MNRRVIETPRFKAWGFAQCRPKSLATQWRHVRM